MLLILAGVSIVTLFGESGIITKSQKASDETNNGVTNDTRDLGKIEKDINKALGEVSVEVKLADGTNLELTKENYGEYLGKEVTNYTGATSVTIGGTSYKVSPTYRLYYVDFDGKYGEKGSIYLKAECTSNIYGLPITDTSADTATNIKIRQLNPGLYNAKDTSGNSVNPPTATNENMKVATWLTNTTNWEALALKDGVNKTISDKINYVVGAPSLEMMMDSYNAHYGLAGDIPDTSTLSASTNRVKLFYKYPYNTNNYGYGVGPSNNSSATNGYYTVTSNYSVKADARIGSMYYSNTSYWLASPSAKSSYGVIHVGCDDGGIVWNYEVYFSFALCPLVSLKSSVQLELGT